MITGPVARQWVFVRFDTFVGPGRRRRNGDALRFLASGEVQIEKCDAGRVSVRSVRWTLQSNGVLDAIVSFDGHHFLVIFHNRGTKQYMTLRQRGPTQADPTVDREYLLVSAFDLALVVELDLREVGELQAVEVNHVSAPPPAAPSARAVALGLPCNHMTRKQTADNT